MCNYEDVNGNIQSTPSGSILLDNISGGTPPYEYLWEDSFGNPILDSLSPISALWDQVDLLARNAVGKLEFER